MSMGIPHQIGSIWSETTSDGCQDEAGKHISAQWKPPSGLNCRTQRPKIDFDMHSLQVSSPPVSPCSSSPSADDWWRRPVYSPTGQSGGIRRDLSVACKALTQRIIWMDGCRVGLKKTYFHMRSRKSWIFNSHLVMAMQDTEFFKLLWLPKRYLALQGINYVWPGISVHRKKRASGNPS